MSVGPEFVIVLFMLVVLALPIGAAIDAAGKPAAAFERANTNRTFWIAVPIVAIVLCAPVAAVLAITWFAAYRKRVVAVSLGDDPVG